MDKDEFAEVMRTLKIIYPAESFITKEWYEMYHKFPVDVVKEGIRKWNREGQWGHKAPLPKDIRDMYVEGRSVGSYDPDGVFQKALDAIEANREIRT